MNPNQPPNYPPGQYPPPQHYPPMYQAMAPQQHPIYIGQATPQYPPATPYMEPMRTIKQEPMWGQDARYGMAAQPPSVPSSMPQYPGQIPPMHTGMPLPGIEIGGRPQEPVAPNPVPYSTYMSPIPPMPTGVNSSNSLLAQHLAAAPSHQPQQQQSQPPPQHSSQLHQLLQQPVYPPPGNQQMQQHHQQQQLQQQQQQQLAEQQRQIQMQNAMRQQSQQQQLQYQPESVQTHKNSFLSADPSSHAFPPSASSTHSAYSRAQEMNAAQTLPLPPTRPEPHTIEDFQKMTTGELCILGRELVTDLSVKTSQLSHMLKKVMERKNLNQGENPNELSDQCRSNLEKMNDIRQIIELRRAPGWKRMTGDDYLTLMLEDSEVKEEDKERRAELEKRIPAHTAKTAPNEGDVWYQGRWIPEELHQKYLRFEANKETMKLLTNDLKNLTWMLEVTSPGHLKRVDQTKISKKREEPT